MPALLWRRMVSEFAFQGLQVNEFHTMTMSTFPSCILVSENSLATSWSFDTSAWMVIARTPCCSRISWATFSAPATEATKLMTTLAP